MRLSDIQSLVFEPSSNCNAQCPHCPRFNIIQDEVFESTGTLHPNLTLSNLDFQKILQNLCLDRMTSLREIRITGDKGDPLMNPGIDILLDAIALLQDRPTVILTTNGSIRNENWWKNLAKKYPWLIVTFSIDGLQDTNHLYRVGLNYETILRNLSAFTESGGRAIWKMILFKHNQHQVKQVEDQAKQLNCEKVIYAQCQIDRFKGLTRWPVIQKNYTYYISPPDIDLPPAVVFKKQPNLSTKMVKEFVTAPDKNCPWAKIGKIYIGYQGYVLPCCMMHFDAQLDNKGRTYLENLSQGFDNQSLLSTSMEKILSNPLFNNQLEQSLSSGKWHTTCAKSCKQQIKTNILTTKVYNN